MIPRNFDPNARVLLSAIGLAFVAAVVVAIASCITGCSASTGTDAATDVIDPTCHVDDATQAYDADAGAYAICHPDEVVWVCTDVPRLEGKCRWLGLGYNWCCPASTD